MRPTEVRWPIPGVSRAELTETPGLDEIALTIHKLLVNEPAPRWCEAWFDVLDERTAGSEWDDTRFVSVHTQLGDPFLWAWRGTPIDIAVTVTAIDVGPNLVTVTARRADNQQPIPDAVICLRQEGGTYVTGTTNLQGTHTFWIDVQSAALSVHASALKPAFIPSTVLVPVGAGMSVGYKRHELSDCINGGDCDSTLEAGEKVNVAITLQNRGTQTSAAGTAKLRPTPGTSS